MITAWVGLGLIGACYAILISVDQLAIYMTAVATGTVLLAGVLEVKDRVRGCAAKNVMELSCQESET